jgi:membrane-bound lytic murein transglycosylase B
MESGFGSSRGNQNVLSAVATLAYDCRRSAYFTDQLFLNYGIGGSLDIAANPLSSTANFLKAHGWRAGAGYQPGEVNFAALQAWNAAPVYEQAIAVIGRQIDGGEGTSAGR